MSALDLPRFAALCTVAVMCGLWSLALFERPEQDSGWKIQLSAIWMPALLCAPLLLRAGLDALRGRSIQVQAKRWAQVTAACESLGILGVCVYTWRSSLEGIWPIHAGIDDAFLHLRVRFSTGNTGRAY